MVSISTFSKEVEDKEESYKASFDKASRSSKDALAICASDLLDNSFYYSLVNDPEVYNHLPEKFSYFLKIAKNKIGIEGFKKK